MLARAAVPTLVMALLASGAVGSSTAIPATNAVPPGSAAKPTFCGLAHDGLLAGASPQLAPAGLHAAVPHTNGCLYSVSALTPTDIWGVGDDNTEYGDKAMIVHWDGTAWAPSPAHQPDASYLRSVSAVAPDDAWSVGYTYTDADEDRAPLIEHWDGSTWRVVASPDPGGSGADLISVSADSVSDAWAVGSIFQFGYRPTANLARWDGSSWVQVDLPDPGCDYPTFNVNAVKALSPSDVWLVGDCPSQAKPFTDHWDGQQWTIQSTPSLGAKVQGATFNSTDAFAPDDVWAAGTQWGTWGGQYGARPLVEHFDGAHWRVTAAPVPEGGNESFFRSISMSSPDDVWAVGLHVSDSQDELLIEHWNGVVWQIVDAPPPNGNDVKDVDLWGVVGTPSHHAWAVGDYEGPLSAHAFAEMWDGSTWRLERVTTPLVHTVRLRDVAADTSDDVWAVGSSGIERPQAVAEHWDGERWAGVPLPPAGATSALETVSATSPSDVWAAGWQRTAARRYSSLMEHWDGSQWQITPTPPILSGWPPDPLSLSADSADDAWCLGFEDKGGPGVAVWHWDGHTWSDAVLPPGHGYDLASVHAVSPTDVWVAGERYDPKADAERVFAAQWDGTAWNVATTGPFAGRGELGTLPSIDAPSASEVIAAGSARLSDGKYHAVVVRWDGTTWSQQRIPGSSQDPDPVSVAEDSGDDAWVLRGFPYAGTPFVNHWNGQRWTIDRTINAEHRLVSAGAVAALTPADVWVVGGYEVQNGSTSAALVHWNGQDWSWFRAG